jgi:pimeloyl-ACP methyl ester carboxylesterase
MRIRTLVVAVLAVGTVALGATACSSDSTKNSAISSTTIPNAQFYATPSSFPTNKPGTLVRAQPMTPPTANSQAWQVMYTSTSETGEPIVVTGMVIAPTGPAPKGGRPVVTWAHPTTGIVDSCAPSLQPEPFTPVEGLSQFLDLGWVVVATDYQGLGTDGPHPYLVGNSEAQGTIDIVRTAGAIPEAGASKKYFVFGHSQGGQAALFVGQMARQYAPDLNLLGVAAADPAGLLANLFDQVGDTVLGGVLGSYAIESWNQVFDYPVSTVLTAQSTPVAATMGQTCLSDPSLNTVALNIASLLNSNQMWSSNPASTQPWLAQMNTNTPGQVGIPVPVLVAEGTDDTLVLPSETAQLVSTYQANGTTITEQLMPGIDHSEGGAASVPYVVPFFQGLAG